ncbi:MAG: hypothetical protein KAY65_13240 [Planctomycetes bacterium]|nr:hypothetical protein [Planctomycetota bacterium]
MGRERIILLTTVLGLIIGGVACYLLGKYFPDYTARTYIQVLPPLRVDPIVSASAVTQKDIQYGHRLSMANLIKQQSTLRKLVDRDTVRQTKWFRRFGGPVDEAVHKACEDLEKHFGTLAHRDSDFIEMWMTCRDAKEATLIVNEMFDVLLASHDTEKAEIAAKISALESQRDVVQRELDALVKKRALDLPRTQSEQLEKIGDERVQMLIALNAQVKKLRIILDDPGKARIQRAARAPEPLQMRYPIWAFLCLPGGGILGFVFGTAIVSISKKAEDKSKRFG